MSDKPDEDRMAASPASNYVEVEAKFEIAPAQIQQVRDQLMQLGGTLTAARQAEDNELYDFEDGRLRGSGCALRLRTYGEDHVLTFKGPVQPDPILKKREELEIRFTNGPVIRQILLRLGLRVSFRYSKFRAIFTLKWQGGAVEVCVDETPVGVFIEIEGPSDAIHQLARHLGFTDYIKESYIELYRQRMKDS